MINIRKGDISEFNLFLVFRAKGFEVIFDSAKEDFGGRGLGLLELWDYVLNLELAR